MTHYGEDTNRRLAAVLEANGVTVSAVHGMGLSSVERIGMTSDAVRIRPRRASVRAPATLLIADNHSGDERSLLKISYDAYRDCNLAVLQSVKRELEDLRQKDMARLSS